MEHRAAYLKNATQEELLEAIETVAKAKLT